MKVELISITAPTTEGAETAEELIAYCARVSNPGNQMNKETAPRLLRYLMRHKHWSPFEMVSMCVSIETSRAIAAQILRHRSFSFQEFSQRYATATKTEPVDLRLAATSNRQSSSVPFDDKTGIVADIITRAFGAYDELIRQGVATETARMVLPLCTLTKLYMNGTIRSWIHYLQQRCDPHTQLEHRLIAIEIQRILEIRFPTVHAAMAESAEA